jgi:hypothetical protein
LTIDRTSLAVWIAGDLSLGSNVHLGAQLIWLGGLFAALQAARLAV